MVMSVATAMIRALVGVVEHSGIPKREFLRGTGLDEGRLADPFGRFDFDEYEALCGIALDMTRADSLGLHLGECATEAAFDLLAHLVPHAPTLRDALALCTQFGSLLISGSHVLVEESVDVARIRYAFRRLSPRVDRMHVELALVGFLRLIRVFAGPKALIDRVCFEHAAPCYRREYRRVFEGCERFEQAFNGIEFSRHLLDARHLHQHPRIYSLLHMEAQRTLETVTSGTGHADRVRRYLMTQPASRLPKMAVAARDLGMSGRSLRRRLADEGVSYRDLVRARLEETAAHVLLTPGRSVQEAAWATGFSDSSAFHRAFRQWKGVSPTEFQRKSHAHGVTGSH